MGVFQSMAGMLSAEITSADIPGFLAAVNCIGIPLFSVQIKDPLTVCVRFYRSDWGDLQTLAERRGETVRLFRRLGVYWLMKSVLSRPVLVVCMTALVLLAVILPTKILFVKVEGNTSVPTKFILEKAELCGITFGASRRQVRSEQMKNSLLSAIPQLQWAGINTVGCTAVISVEERAAKELSKPEKGVGSIVAVRDGIVQSCTVTKGNALCKTGQAVKAGEVLVSGYTDCGIKIQATRAEAEIFAQTIRELTVLTPVNYALKGDVKAVEKKYCIIIGKKRINFYKDSGISDTTCDKMYREYALSLPGGFTLPISFGIEQRILYNNQSVAVASGDAQSYLADFADDYLPGQMVSGKILARREAATQLADVCCLQGQYICLEMIGRVQSEEIIGNHVEID